MPFQYLFLCCQYMWNRDRSICSSIKCALKLNKQPLNLLKSSNSTAAYIGPQIGCFCVQCPTITIILSASVCLPVCIFCVSVCASVQYQTSRLTQTNYAKTDNIPAHIHERTHAHTQARTHIRTHAHTHTHTHTLGRTGIYIRHTKDAFNFTF